MIRRRWVSPPHWLSGGSWSCGGATSERSAPNEYTEEGWSFLEPYLAPCRAYVFSHSGFVPELLEGAAVFIIAPSIDPYSAKNRPIERMPGWTGFWSRSAFSMTRGT